MANRGIIIVFSGALGSYTGALSVVVAELLQWKWVRFSDFLRNLAKAQGEDPNDRAVLQRIGQELVQKRPEYFVRSVLESAGWRPGDNLILDGLRHQEIFHELSKQVGHDTIRVIHISLSDQENRVDRTKRADGLTDHQFTKYASDLTEAQVEEAPHYAIELDGATPRGELAQIIIRLLIPDFQSRWPDDDGELVSRMEPSFVESRTELSTLARELIEESTAFAAEVPVGLAQPLAGLVRAMNCYYSNRLEGHGASLPEIELALRGNYENDAQKRYLQQEAGAHITVQRWIDSGGLAGKPASAARSLIEIHDRFFSEFPDVQWVKNSSTGERVYVIPGAYRNHYIEVSRHVAPSPGSITRFMARFEQVYGRPKNPKETVLRAAAAHHRLLWIHPFSDGNGRVARLMSDAMLSQSLQTHSIWSVSRGLALQDAKYRQHLSACDQDRRGDLDGRGNLSEGALAEFTAFFLTTCLDQVRFMRQRMRLDQLMEHIEEWVKTCAAFGDRNSSESHPLPRLDPAAGKLLKIILEAGSYPIAHSPDILGPDVRADRVIQQLANLGVVKEKRGDLTFSLPINLAEKFIPGLFP